MKEYIPMCGEPIEEAIINSLKLSFKNYTTVTFKFNGIVMEIDYWSSKTYEYYFGVWKAKCKERSDSYKASLEAKSTKVKQDNKLSMLQEELDVTIGRMPLEHGEGLLNFVGWLKRFVELTDRVGITYNKDFVLKGLAKLGYKENDYVGYDGEWTTEISVKYITGQIINCLNTIGLIPPVAITMCDKVLNNNSL